MNILLAHLILDFWCDSLDGNDGNYFRSGPNVTALQDTL